MAIMNMRGKNDKVAFEGLVIFGVVKCKNPVTLIRLLYFMEYDQGHSAENLTGHALN